MEAELARAYQNPPKGVAVGRVLMWIGSILFFAMAIGDLIGFIFAFASPDFAVDWGDPAAAVKTATYPLLSLFFVISGIGGICFILDRGKMRSFATLAAVVMLITIVIDFVFTVRTLIYDWMNPERGAAYAWAAFALDLLDIELSGGVYFTGWFLCKDFVGD